MMGFPAVPFHLCDFWSVYSEKERDGMLIVRGTLPGGTEAVAKFREQPGPRGSWRAHSLEAA